MNSGVGFAGVRTFNGSCICVSTVRRPLPGLPRLTEFMDGQRFTVKSSNVILVYPSSGTSFHVHVFGPSKARNRVYNGTLHDINGCICSRNLASGYRVVVRALNNLGRLRLAVRRHRTLSNRGRVPCGGHNFMDGVGTGVNTPVLSAGGVPIGATLPRFIRRRMEILSGAFCVATIS